MRLQTKTSIYFHSFVLIVFTVGIIAFYFMLKAHFDANIKKDLYIQREQIIEYATKYKVFPTNSHNLEISKSNVIRGVEIGDTTLINSSGDEISYRTLSFYLDNKSDIYKIKILKSLENRNFFLIQMVTGLSSIILLIMAGIFILNRYSLSRVWSVFYDTIRKINSYEINDSLELKESNVREFKILNTVLNRMTNKIRKDYNNLKEFTENTSHEIQTPLAIIRSKLEMVLQTENLTESQVRNIHAAYETANRLSKLNETLILLTKIENKQYRKAEKVNISKLIINQLEIFEDIIQSKKIIKNISIDDNVVIFMNKELSHILFQNLIKNAVKYVPQEGVLKIGLVNESFVITNTGDRLSFDSNQIFSRFKKSDKYKTSIGLGLSIVKEICDFYEFEITYTFQEPIHQFVITNLNKP